MPYYGVPMDVTYEGVSYEHNGMAFSKQIVTELLRNTLGFNGYVNSDTGIINQRAWGVPPAGFGRATQVHRAAQEPEQQRPAPARVDGRAASSAIHVGPQRSRGGDAEYGGYSVVVGDRSAATGNRRAPVPKDTDHVIIRVEVTNPTGVTSTYRSDDPATGGRINATTRRAWGADDPDRIDNG